MVIEDKQAGTMLLEVILLIALLMILAARAVPEACKFYRQAAVEYEAEQLLSSIRYCQNMSRMTEESAWGYGAKESRRHYVFIKLFPDYNQIAGSGRDIIGSHHYLPGVKAVKIHQEQGQTIFDAPVELFFRANGQPKTGDMMTILIYYQGYPQDGQRIMVSKGGRIRMERGGVAK